MSGWHANTKSVKSYGKNRTRVVKVLVDLSDDTPVKPSSSHSPVYHHTVNSPAKGGGGLKFVRASTSTSSLGGGRKDVLQDKNGRGEMAAAAGELKREGVVDGWAEEKGKKEKVFTVRTDDEDELNQDPGQENIGAKLIPRKIITISTTSRTSKLSLESSSSAAEMMDVVRPTKGAGRMRSRKQVIPSTPPSSSASPAPSSTTTRSSRSRSARASSDSPPPPSPVRARRSKRAIIPDTPPPSSSQPSPLHASKLASLSFSSSSPTTLNSITTITTNSDDDEDEEEDNETTLQPLPPPPSSESASASASSLSLLLHACNQSTQPTPFTTFLSNPLLFSSNNRTIITKVGEATYSEVFSLSSSGKGSGAEIERDLVMKVVPLMMREETEEGLEVAMEGLSLQRRGEAKEEEIDELDQDEEVEPTWSDPRDVAKEVRLGRLVGELDGFCDLIGAFVVQGAYPSQLLDQWDAFAAENPDKTENARPSVFPSHQLYAVLLLPYGGIDLESYSFSRSHGWAEAAGVFWSVSQAIAVAEKEVRFEHRDLHLGQILVQPSSDNNSNSYSSSGPFDTSSGLETTIIDFGLSRVDAPSSSSSSPGEKETWWTPLEEEIFEGEGRQWDVYRSMRDHIGEDWTGYHPNTNLMWLSYILSTLLNSKLLLPPPPTSSRSRIKKTKRETEAWKCLEGTRKELERVLKGEGGEGAGGLVRWGREKGWCA